MDGALKASFPNETRFAKECYDMASSKKITFTGLSKTSRLFTTSGMSLTGAILEMAKRNNIEKTWFYNPLAQSHSPAHAAELYVIKLHPLSDRVFRFDIQSEQVKSLGKNELIDIYTLISAR